MKKLLAFILCLAMILSLGAAASASGEPSSEELASQEPAADVDEYTLAVAANGGNAGSLGHVVADPPSAIRESGTVTFPDEYPRELIYPISAEEIDTIVNAVVGAMTFSEKCALAVSNHSGVPRLGVPMVVEHDGPAGVSSSPFETTALPNAQLLATTWDTQSAYDYGLIIGEEEVSTGSNRHLGLQLDVQRNPFWHRSRDTLGEDFFFVGDMAVAETEGIQDAGTMAMAKHIGAYNTIGDKNINVIIDEQTYQTAYLYPFEQAAKRADLASIMSSYQRINGIYSASSAYVQKYTARDLWNWNGAFITDAGGNVENSIPFGTDGEMGMTYNTEANIRAWITAGLMTMDDLDAMCYHSLYALGQAGYLNLVEIDPITGLAKDEPGRTAPIDLVISYEEDRAAGMYAEHTAMAQEIAEKGVVLLKNEGDVLPLDSTGSIALIGYPVTTLDANVDMERSPGTTGYMDTIEEAFRAEFPDTDITAAVYDTVFGELIPADALYLDKEGTQNGLLRTYGISTDDWIGASSRAQYAGSQTDVLALYGTFSNGTQDIVMEGHAIGEVYGIDEQIEFITGDGSTRNSAENRGEAFETGEAYTWKGYLKAPEDGVYSIIIESIGGSAGVRLNSTDGTELESAGSASGEMMGGPGGPDGGSGEASGNASGETKPGLKAVTGGVVGWNNITKDGFNYSAIRVELEAGKMYELTVTVENNTVYYDQGIRLTWITPSMPDRNRQAALDAAASCDTVICFAVHNAANAMMASNNLATYDLTLRDLEAVKALQEAAKANGNTFIVVVYGRTCFSGEGDWLDDTDALLMAYYPGQGGSPAIANIFSGDVNPSGKLQQTYPKVSTDTLLTHYGQEGLIRLAGDRDQTYYDAYYDEGLHFGYRWYDWENIEPLYAYGYGLSYTTFEYSDLTVTPVAEGVDDIGFDVSFTITNTGDVTGSEIAQVYVTGLGEDELPADVQTYVKQLCGFARVEDIRPGESREVTVHVNQRSLSYWWSDGLTIEREDGTADKFHVFPGERTILVGTASDNILLSETVDIR